MKKITLFSWTLFGCLYSIPLFLSAQIRINAYARVTNLTTNTTVTLSNVNENHDTYENGEQVIIWQVQDDVIGTNTNDAANFGSIANIANAGIFEWATIASHTEASNIPTTLTFTRPLQHNYNTGPNSRVQVISFPEMGSPNYSTTADITGLAWDGTIGGVVAFQVAGTLTLQHAIDGNQLGFRGGQLSRNMSGARCSPTPFINNDNQYGGKGESIYPRGNANFQFARGKITNGGGGGNHHNGGGGGGANYSAGGNGGQGWNGGQQVCPSGSEAGGLGGEALAAFIAPNRIFLGGGGGGGQQNNSRGTAGAAGGGLVFIRAQELATIGNCTRLGITANGGNSADGGNDGIGGAGAGGTVVLQIPQFTIAPSCPLEVSANGGNGGRVNSSPHGGGGGGGQGAIVYTIPQPSNVVTHTLNGNGGCNNNSDPCTNQAASGAGSNDVGILTSVFLPIELGYFEGSVTTPHTVSLSWGATIVELGGWFTLERSPNGIHFEDLYTLDAQPQQGSLEHFHYLDAAPLSGSNYYRLRWTDMDGATTYSDMLVFEVTLEHPSIVVYPNPAQNYIHIKTPFQTTTPICELLNLNGQSISVPIQLNGPLTTLSTTDLPRGIYLLRIRSEVAVKTMRIVLN